MPEADRWLFAGGHESYGAEVPPNRKRYFYERRTSSSASSRLRTPMRVRTRSWSGRSIGRTYSSPGSSATTGIERLFSRIRARVIPIPCSNPTRRPVRHGSQKLLASRHTPEVPERRRVSPVGTRCQSLTPQHARTVRACCGVRLSTLLLQQAARAGGTLVH
jgi:hypothetical protein